MNDLDKKAFEEAYNSIKAPADLKADTLEKMVKEDKRQAQSSDIKRYRIHKKPVVGYVSLAMAICGIFFAVFFLRPEEAVYLTAMEDGVFYDEVELKDGVIHFVRNRVAISVTPSAGGVVIGQETEKADEEKSKTEEVRTESGGVISFRETAALSLPEIAEEKWSYIGEQKIYVTVLNMEPVRYQAAFEKEGSACEMTGEGVTQKEFIDELYRRVKD